MEQERDNGATTFKVRETRKVDFHIFVWVISILSGAMLAISSYLFTEVAQLRAENALLKGDVQARMESERDARQLIREIIVQLQTEVNFLKNRELTGR